MTDEEQRHDRIIRVSKLLAEALEELNHILGYQDVFYLPISSQTLPDFNRVGALRKGLSKYFFGGYDWRSLPLQTLGHLASLTEKEVLLIRNIGPCCLVKIKQALAGHGLFLDDERAKSYVRSLTTKGE